MDPNDVMNLFQYKDLQLIVLFHIYNLYCFNSNLHKLELFLSFFVPSFLIVSKLHKEFHRFVIQTIQSINQLIYKYQYICSQNVVLIVAINMGGEGRGPRYLLTCMHEYYNATTCHCLFEAHELYSMLTIFIFNCSGNFQLQAFDTWQKKKLVKIWLPKDYLKTKAV